jgi:beta-lactamase superfamily II metal-dependent hydrolase
LKPLYAIVCLVLIAAVGVGSFFGGMKFQQTKNPSPRQFQAGQGRGGQFQGANQNQFRPVNGDIVSSDDKSITVKLQDGSSKIVIYSDSTTVNKTSEGSRDDLKVGEKVMVIGTVGSDETVTAQSIQLNPILRNETPAPNQ